MRASDRRESDIHVREALLSWQVEIAGLVNPTIKMIEMLRLKLSIVDNELSFTHQIHLRPTALNYPRHVIDVTVGGITTEYGTAPDVAAVITSPERPITAARDCAWGRLVRYHRAAGVRTGTTWYRSTGPPRWSGSFNSLRPPARGHFSASPASGHCAATCRRSMRTAGILTIVLGAILWFLPTEISILGTSVTCGPPALGILPLRAVGDDITSALAQECRRRSRAA